MSILFLATVVHHPHSSEHVVYLYLHPLGLSQPHKTPRGSSYTRPSQTLELDLGFPNTLIPGHLSTVFVQEVQGGSGPTGGLLHGR